MTSKKRKYGDLSARPLPNDQSHLIDDVFAAFTGPRRDTDDAAQKVETGAAQAGLPSKLDSTRLDSTRLDSPPLNSTQLTPSVAPTRDFNRRANSIERDALPAGLFPGTSKKLYDALYLRTRGAITPVRSIKATRTELMRWANIGGLNTFLSHMKYLTGVGLVERSFEIGDKEGAIYEVRLPEELDSTQLTPTRLNSTRIDSTPDRVHDSTQKVMRVESGQTIETKEQTPTLKTSFKTKDRSDDEAFAKLRSVARELTGREAVDWSELESVLVAELRIAAARTTVSSVPAFLAEHLRRRLWKVDKRQANAEGRELPDSSPAAPVKAPQDCPDCKGAGWWYPDGPEKGVAKCRHERLTSI